jgi:hypothetical protein
MIPFLIATVSQRINSHVTVLDSIKTAKLVSPTIQEDKKELSKLNQDALRRNSKTR